MALIRWAAKACDKAPGGLAASLGSTWFLHTLEAEMQLAVAGAIYTLGCKVHAGCMMQLAARRRRAQIADAARSLYLSTPYLLLTGCCVGAWRPILVEGNLVVPSSYDGCLLL